VALVGQCELGKGGFSEGWKKWFFKGGIKVPSVVALL